MDTMSDTPTTACPTCGSTAVAPLLYGLPVAGAFEAADRGEVIIAGCVIRDETDGCLDCGARWAAVADWNARPLG